MTATVPPDTKLNITVSSLSYFAGDALGVFLLYFAIGLVIYLIFSKSKRNGTELVESSTTNETNSNLPI